MKNEHLTEAQLQKAAETNIQGNLHLESCESCKNKVQNYRFIYNSIKELDQPAFDFDLAAAVIAQLPPTTTPKQFAYLPVIVAALATLAIGCVIYPYWNQIALLFVNLAPTYLQIISIPVFTFGVVQGILYYINYIQKMKQLNIN